MKPFFPKGLLNCFLAASLNLVPVVTAFAEEQESSETGEKQEDRVMQESFEDEETPKVKPSQFQEYLEEKKRRTDTRVQKATRWVDSFFGDQEYIAEVATTQFRLRPELLYRREQGLKLKGKAYFKIHLPNLERNVSLVGGTSDPDSEFDEAVEDDVRDPALGLQFFGRVHNKWNTSISVGVKFNDFAGFAGPRIRYLTDWTKNTSFRFTQKILWQTNNEWQSRSRFDVNVLISDRYFFRQSIDGRWRGEHADEEGFRTRISSILTRPFTNAAGLQAEVSAVFHTRPDTHVNEYTAALRYRKRTWRDWFYYEIVPQISWEDEFDYRFNPGIRFRIELFFDSESSSAVWKREAEDTDDFRW